MTKRRVKRSTAVAPRRPDTQRQKPEAQIFSTTTTGISGDVRVVNIGVGEITHLSDGHGITTVGTFKAELH